MDRQDLINTRVFEQFQGLLFSDLSGPLNLSSSNAIAATCLLVACGPQPEGHSQSEFCSSPKQFIFSLVLQ